MWVQIGQQQQWDQADRAFIKSVYLVVKQANLDGFRKVVTYIAKRVSTTRTSMM